jgi:glycosyltransferase involved in cell wall biosynthesis
MRILLLAYHFPPDPAVGSLRAAKVAEAFRSRGHQVDVITARRPGERSSRRDAAPGVTATAVRVWPGPREWWGWFKRRRKSSPAPAEEPTDPAPEPRAPGWKRLVLSLIWTPDDRQGFILPALGRALVKAWRADFVYSTAPPFSTHLTGLLLRWLMWKRWVVELRDPWTANAWKPQNARTRLSEAVERWMERRCLGAAHRIVAVSEGIATLLRQSVSPRIAAKVIVARNGIDMLAPTRKPRDPDAPVRIVYVGTFYFNRDPSAFLTALAATRDDSGSRFHLDLVGQTRWFCGRSVEQMVRELALEDVVTFHDWMPHAECQRIIQSADLLLLLAQGQPAQIPNKLYEYLGTRIPILAFADDQGESAGMLRAIGGHVVVSGDSAEEVRDGVREALRVAIQPGMGGSEATLRGWTTDAQMDRIIASLEPPKIAPGTAVGTRASSPSD